MKNLRRFLSARLDVILIYDFKFANVFKFKKMKKRKKNKKFSSLQVYCAECGHEECAVKSLKDTTGYCLNCDKIVDACNSIGERLKDD